MLKLPPEIQDLYVYDTCTLADFRRILNLTRQLSPDFPGYGR